MIRPSVHDLRKRVLDVIGDTPIPHARYNISEECWRELVDAHLRCVKKCRERGCGELTTSKYLNQLAMLANYPDKVPFRKTGGKSTRNRLLV